MEKEIRATNFVADGPAPKGHAGFTTEGQTSNFRVGVQGVVHNQPGSDDVIGVQGIASLYSGPGLGQGVGVQGTTKNPETNLPGPGVGVDGLSTEGTGVRGRDEGGGTGVEGRSKTGTGVRGRTEGGGTGVEGRSGTGTGVMGFSEHIGVQGDGGSIGVLGGGPAPTVLTSRPSYVGVAGTCPTDPSGFTFSYGGWFSRGEGIQGGTAQLHLEPAGPDAPKPPDAAQRGDLFVDPKGGLWFCQVSGDSSTNPATWKQLA